MQWYVYYLIDTRTHFPIYVGKGKGRRAHQHVNRALKWKSKGRPLGRGINAKLWHKILSILDDGFEVIHEIVQNFEFEQASLDFEKEEIKRIGIENLCNLTNGGEGEQRCQESLVKLSNSLQKFWTSERGNELKKRFSEERMGSDNPMWGVVEDEDHKIARMKNLLATTRWNKGKRGDPRSKGHKKGTPTHNAIACRLIHDDGRTFVANSVAELSRISGVPRITLARLSASPMKKTRNGWIFERQENACTTEQS